MKKIIISLIFATIFLSGCGLGEIVDGAVEMNKTVEELTSIVNLENAQALTPQAIEQITQMSDQLQEQWQVIEGLVGTIDSDLHEQITSQLELLQQITSAEIVDPNALLNTLDDLTKSVDALQVL